MIQLSMAEGPTGKMPSGAAPRATFKRRGRMVVRQASLPEAADTMPLKQGRTTYIPLGRFL